MTESLQELLSRPRRYYFSDGLVEMGVGLLFSLSALLLLGLRTLFDRPLLAGALAVLTLLSVWVAAVLVKRGVETAKERITYPRTGYARSDAQIGWTGRSIIMATALLLAVLGILLPEELNRAAFAVGAIMSIVLVVFGARSRLTRFYILAALTVLLTLIGPYLVPSESGAGVVVLGGVGLLLLTSGGIAFARYLIANRGPEADVDG